MSSRKEIVSALEAFVKKYYRNLLIKGALYSIGIVVGLFLVAVFVEHFGWLPSLGRGILFWGGVGAVGLVLAIFLLRPWLKMRGIGKRLSYSEAATIIGNHFPEVGDKLLNLLQLTEEEECSSEENSLLLAAIEQKTALLRPVPLLSAIDLRANRRYLKYALPPLLVVIVLLLLSPQLLTEPSRRIVHYHTAYEKPAPFRFAVVNDRLEVQSGDDYDLRVAIVEASASPAEVFVCEGGRRHRMVAQPDGQFAYTFKQVCKEVNFVLEGGGVVSRGYTLEVRPNPTILDFTMEFSYPSYTGRVGETVANIGDAIVPEGTKVHWHIRMRDADSLVFISDTLKRQLEVKRGGVSVDLRARHTIDYAFFASNAFSTSDTLHYTLTTLDDAAPAIAVEEVVDSAYPDRRMFFGRIRDDYGFSRLVFVHKIDNATSEENNALKETEIALGEGAAQEFSFVFNLAELQMLPGERLTYYFEVYDNDEINGPKSTRSQVFERAEPSEVEVDSLLEQGANRVRQSVEGQMSELRQLQEEIGEMQRHLVDKKELDWQEKNELKQLAEKQRKVRQMMQQMAKQIQENNRLEQKYREQSEQLREKQREIDRLLNEVMDEKMRQVMDEIDRMLGELDKQKVQQKLDQLKISNAELEKQLDQNLELLKRLEVEKRLEMAISKASELASEQHNVSRETKDATSHDKEALQAKQQSLNEQVEQLRKSIEQIEQDYRDLDPSPPFQAPTDRMQQVQQHQQKASQQLEKGKNNDASDEQEQAADGLDQLESDLADAKTAMEQDGLAEDAEQVRRLLENLVLLSFNQEKLIDDAKSIYIQDPRYQQLIAGQNRVKDDFRGVEDSLRAVARRQVQVASMVTKELAEVNSAIGRALGSLVYMNEGYYNGYRNSQATVPMQYSMTSLNNLALVLAESLDQMKNQMRQNAQAQKSGKQRKPGNSTQKCNNPGNRPSPQSMKQMQQELNRQMEALKKQLDAQGGKQNGRHKVGQGQSVSEEFARMAAQQEMIRRMMQQYGQELKEGDAANGKLAREIDQIMRQMEQTESDLVNRTITHQTIQRQQKIMTRLLEHERAELQRQKEERRESREANTPYGQPSPAEIKKYKRAAQPSADQLQTVPPSFAPFYREKVNDYFYR